MTLTTRRGWLFAALAAAVTVLLGSILASVAWAGAAGPGLARTSSGWMGTGPRSGDLQAAPDLPGTVVEVSLSSMGGPVMGGRNTRGGGMGGGTMWLTTDQTAVRHGSVSFLATNESAIDHELVVLPLAAGERVGARAIGDDDQVDEAGSLGEASNNNAEGTGDGILPGGTGWVSLTLLPGRYEVVCNLPGHYAAGMYTLLTVT